MSNQIISELFDLRNIEYNLLSQADFSVGAVHTTNHGLRLLIYFAPKIWTIIPTDIRNVNNSLDFTLKIKFWIPDRCPYNLPRQVGYINWCLGLILFIFRVLFFLKKLAFLLICWWIELKCFYCIFVYNGVNTVFTRKSAYAPKSISLRLASLPFDVKYLTSASLEWAPLFNNYKQFIYSWFWPS